MARQAFWLQEDQRDRSYNYGNRIDDAMLTESYGAQENQLEMVTTIGTAFAVADRPKYIGTTFYDGIITEMPRAERSMPEPLSADIELAECKVTLCNIDKRFTPYLPGGPSYTTFYGQPVSIKIGLRDVGESLRSVFTGVVSHENGVSYKINEVTFKFRDRLDSLNNKLPLESLTKEAFPYMPDENIGKLIPLMLGDFEAGWEWQENGTTPYKLGEDSNIDVLNMTPINIGAGVPGYYIGGGFFLFSTGGRANKTYRPETIKEVMIKRGSGYLKAAFTADAINVGGHWCVHVGGVVAKSTDDEYINYAYVWQAGDMAVIQTRIPIGELWDDAIDCNPLYQAVEALIALGRISDSEIDYGSLTAVNVELQKNTGMQQAFRFEFREETMLGSVTLHKPMFFWVMGEDNNEVPMGIWCKWAPGEGEEIFPESDPRCDGKHMIIIEMMNTVYGLEEYAMLYMDALNNDAAFVTLASTLPLEVITTDRTVQPRSAFVKVVNTYKGACTPPDPTDSTIIMDMMTSGLGEGIVHTRIWFGEKDKTVLGMVSGLLKCCLIDMFVNAGLEISFKSLWPSSWPSPSVCKRINQYDIREESIEIFSEPKLFLTTAQANYGWVYWLNTASKTTKKRKNDNAVRKTGREVVKEFDIPNVYLEKDILPILECYIRLASAALVSVKMELGWKHLLRDLGEFVSITVQLGSLNWVDVPCQIRKISVLPKVTGIEVEMLSFVNFSYQQYNSPSAGGNLSSYDMLLVDG